MKIVFISDAHLKGPQDPFQEKAVRFLEGLTSIDRLVVLGDLFDFWTGSNHVVLKNYRPVLEALKRLAGRGVKITYLEGNHDFSMGSFFTGELGADVYAEAAEIVIDNKRFYLGHGDAVKMTTGYRLWRAYLRSPVFRVMAGIATPPVVWNIALDLSKRSRRRAYKVKSNTTEPALKALAEKKIGEGFDCVVFGHSHLAGVHRIKAGIYANPGSLRDGSYLTYEAGEWGLRRF